MKFREIEGFISAGSWECDYTLDEFVERIKSWEKEEGLQMIPDFQRGHVWNEAQQIAYIEYLLRGGKTAKVIYLNNPNWQGGNNKEYTEFVCVDGLQRATAIQRFVENEIKVFGHYYMDYEDSPRMTQGIRININQLDSKRKVLEWYYEQNAGGIAHTNSELERIRKMIEQEAK